MTLRADRTDPWFTSRRERRLWASSLLVLALIALGLVAGPVLAETIGDRGVLDAAFVAGLPVVGATVVALATDVRARRIEIGIGLALVAASLPLVARTGLSPAERTHLIEYAVLAALIHAALVERAANGRRVPYPAASRPS